MASSKKKSFCWSADLLILFSLVPSKKNATPADWKAIKHEEMKEIIKLGVEEVFKN